MYDGGMMTVRDPDHMFDTPLTLCEIILRAARHHPDRLALIDGDRRLTFADVIARSAALAAAFRARGCQPGDRVALLDANSSLCVFGYYACVLGGFVAVPLNTRLALPELAEIVALTEVRLILHGAGFGDSARDLADGMYATISDEAMWALPDLVEPYEPAPVPADAVVQIFFTSGTTGRPKGVCLSGRALVHSAIDAIIGFGLGSDDIWLHAAPMFHLVDAWAVWAMPLVAGAQATLAFRPDTFVETVERSGATVTNIPPVLIDMVTATAPDPARLRTLRLLAFGGSPTTPGVLHRARAVFGCPLVQTYGATETSGSITIARSFDRGAVSVVGKAAASIALRIADAAGHDVSGNEAGEVLVGGPRVMLGYWRDEAATRAALVDGWYRTGDLGRLGPSGDLELVGRAKDMIITGGENVYPAEVEAALSRHPDVREVAVIGLPDARWGEAVTAVVVLAAGAPRDAAALGDYCRPLIANYKIPKRFIFSDSSLPTSGAGKIVKHRLRAELLAAGEGAGD